MTVPVVTQPVPGVSVGRAARRHHDGAGRPARGATTTVPAEAACDAPTLFAVVEGGDRAAARDRGRAAVLRSAVGLDGGRRPGQERALGVFVPNPAGDWRLVNLGTDQVCSGAGVPPELSAALGCAQWETE